MAERCVRYTAVQPLFLDSRYYHQIPEAETAVSTRRLFISKLNDRVHMTVGLLDKREMPVLTKGRIDGETKIKSEMQYPCLVHFHYGEIVGISKPLPEKEGSSVDPSSHTSRGISYTLSHTGSDHTQTSTNDS
jgi:hypothetical protein